MLNEIYEITYMMGECPGMVRLDCNGPKFNELLREVEQNLADRHATDIVYTRRERKDDDFPKDEPIYQQVSFLD